MRNSNIGENIIVGQPEVIYLANDYQSLYVNDQIFSKAYSWRTREDEFRNRAVPDASIDICFRWDLENELRELMVIGPALKLTDDYLVMEKNSEVFTLRLQPGSSVSIFGVPSHEWMNNTLRVKLDREEDILLMDELYQKETLMEKYQFAQSVLKDYISLLKDDKSQLACQINKIIQNNMGEFNLDKIAEKTGYTPYYMNKIFRGHTGFTMGNYQKVLRFQNVLKCFELCRDAGERPDHAMIASEFGYTDQAHMINNVKAFSGDTPGKLWDKYYH